MAEMDMSHSLSSLPPLGDPPTMDLDLSLTSTYTNTPAGSPLSTTVVCIILAIFKIFLKSTFFSCVINILFNVKSCYKTRVIECVDCVSIWGQAGHSLRTSLRQWRCLDLTVFPWSCRNCIGKILICLATGTENGMYFFSIAFKLM